MRHPTREATDSLARRFGFPLLSDDHQDWEFQVADSSRIREFLRAYESDELTEDEGFVLMQTIIQSFEDLENDLSGSQEWKRVLELIERDIDVHISSVWYWTGLETSDSLSLAWRVSPCMREMLARHRSRFW